MRPRTLILLIAISIAIAISSLGIIRLNSETPVQTLERLCAGSTTTSEETLEASIDFYDMDEYAEMEAVERDFCAKHRRMVDEVSKHWGRPAFDGDPESPGFPDWAAEETIVLATWKRGAKRIAYLSIIKHDKETPYFLNAGCTASKN